MYEVQRKKWASLDCESQVIGKITSIVINGHYLVSEARIDSDIDDLTVSRLVLIPDSVWERRKVQSLSELQQVLETLDCYSRVNDSQDYPRKVFFSSPKGETTLIIYELRQWLGEEPEKLDRVLKILECHVKESTRVRDSYWQSRLPELWIDFLKEVA